MGEYFYYLNQDRKLLFDIGLNVFNTKFSRIGWNGIANRAFCLLLTQSSHDRYNHTLIGSWIGNHVILVAIMGSGMMSLIAIAILQLI